jgi:hypothetical protein
MAIHPSDSASALAPDNPAGVVVSTVDQASASVS